MVLSNIPHPTEKSYNIFQRKQTFVKSHSHMKWETDLHQSFTPVAKSMQNQPEILQLLHIVGKLISKGTTLLQQFPNLTPKPPMHVGDNATVEETFYTLYGVVLSFYHTGQKYFMSYLT